jgi:hypothetical protein
MRGLGGMSRFQLFKQPLARVTPATLQRAELDTEGIRGFFVGEAEEIFDFDDVAPLGLDGVQLVKKIIHDNGLIKLWAHGRKQIFNPERSESGDGPAARVIDEVPAHGSGGYREEVSAVLPILISRADETHIDLVDEFCRLQGVTLALAAHEVAGQTAKIRHDAVEQLVLGIAAAGSPFVQEAGDVGIFGRHVVSRDFRVAGLYLITRFNGNLADFIGRFAYRNVNP